MHMIRYYFLYEPTLTLSMGSEYKSLKQNRMANTPPTIQSANENKQFQSWQDRMERKQEYYEWRMQSLLQQTKQLK